VGLEPLHPHVCGPHVALEEGDQEVGESPQILGEAVRA